MQWELLLVNGCSALGVGSSNVCLRLLDVASLLPVVIERKLHHKQEDHVRA